MTPLNQEKAMRELHRWANECPQIGEGFPPAPCSADYVLFSVKHTNGIAVWERDKQCGYTDDLSTAGRFTEEYAKAAERSCHGDTLAIPLADALKLKTRTIVDLGDGNNRANIMKAAKPNTGICQPTTASAEPEAK
jgi:hypothetical protein